MSNSYATAPIERIARPSLGQTVGYMKKYAVLGSNDMNIRRLVERICAEIQPGDYASEVLACYYWVCQNIRYMRDIYNTELLKWPIRVVESKSGDCDDIATLLAAMMMACGNRCSFVLAAFNPPPAPPMPSHVFTVVHTPGNGQITLDPVANRATERMWGRIRHSILVPVGGEGDGMGRLGRSVA